MKANLSEARLFGSNIFTAPIKFENYYLVPRFCTRLTIETPFFNYLNFSL
jgi:hypothetical protein